MRIRYFCHYGALTGYGRAARDYLAALHQTGDVELEIAVFGQGPDALVSPERRYRHLDAFAVPLAALDGTPDVEIFHAQPRLLATVDEFTPRVTQRTAPRVALTTWETSILPEIYARALARFDAVIVPSDFCAEIVDCAHVDLVEQREIVPRSTRLSYVVPHCFDESWWTKRTPRHREPGSRCRFYSIGAWGERKNMLGLIRTYLHEFTKSDDVQMMLLIADANFDEIRSLITRSGLPESEIPQLSVPFATMLNDEELVELHASADCFVSATRGEGFGLGMFEAAIMGVTVIAPLYGGHDDFLDLSTCKAIPFQMTPCFGTERKRVSDDAIAVAIAPGVNCRQMWAEPDLAALAANMRHVYENSTYTQTDQRPSLEARFGYKTVGKRFVHLLREIAST